MSALQITWFGLVGVLLAGYMILDGYDLGVGVWHLFAKSDEPRQSLIASILPFWDGNEVWLLTGGGAVFAAFPMVYAAVFSGFYLALMLVLFALIFRSVSLEFRNQSDSEAWKRFWDRGFAFGSILPALLLGVAMGNIIRGLPLNDAADFTGTFFTLLNPYSLLIGVTGLAMFAAHGALYATMKTDGDLAKNASVWARNSGMVFCVLLTTSALVTILTRPDFTGNYRTHPALWLLPVIMLTAAWCSTAIGARGKILPAFLLSSGCMLAIVATVAAGLFPNWVPAINDASLSLTIANSSSSPLTLKTMLILAAIGVPIVLAYTVWVQRIFRGKAGEGVSY
jgi:cytochrome bd ubiquinol oxidase subunit II